ncbi:MAG: hypothetical protein ACRD3V_33220 [Vicinamibacteria bacterium]
MSPGVALAVGIGLGLAAPVLLAIWIIVRGRVSPRGTMLVLAAMIVASIVLAISTGSFKSGILLLLGVGVGLAVSSVVTLPLRAVYAKRWGDASARRSAP